jgi:triacylglycerol esterase/lipase EstA (alpha/beta hydrolase family)
VQAASGLPLLREKSGIAPDNHEEEPFMQRRMRFTAGLLCAAGLAAASIFGAGAASAQVGSALPVNYSFAAALAMGLASPTVSPAGSNNFSCRPTAAHPYPVVLVHGTIENMNDNWQAASPLLANNGYCVFALSYGGPSSTSPTQATGDIPTSAGQLAAFVDRVLAATGAAKVDMVGHSQGGMIPRYYFKFLGGASKVHTLVGLSPSNHGTTIDGLTTLEQLMGVSLGDLALGITCGSCVQQEVGSAFMTRLNAGGDTVPGVNYTVIETRYDEVVTPYTSAFLTGPDVTNITVQNQCPLDLSDHLQLSYDPVALADMLNALDPAHRVPVRCTAVLPVLGPAGPVPFL